MTKKHFKAIAQVVSEYHKAEITGDSYNLASGLADVLEKFNPAFDRVRFLKACEPITNTEFQKLCTHPKTSFDNFGICTDCGYAVFERCYCDKEGLTNPHNKYSHAKGKKI